MLDPRFRGNVPALVTPCRPDGTVDTAALRRIVEHVIAGGVKAFNVLGTTGEFALVPSGQRRAAIETAVAAAAGRVPVMVGCGRPGLAETVAEIEEAAGCGAQAVLVTPSYYFPLNDSEAIRFFGALRERAAIPILYYHIPQLTRATAGLGAIARLASEGAICGIKDSSGDGWFLYRLLAEIRHLSDFRTFVGGSGFLLAALVAGIDGVTGALSNFAPRLDQAVIDSVAAGDLAKAQEGQAEIVRANARLFLGMRPNPAAVSKLILAHLGLCEEHMFAPLASLDEADRAAVLDALPSFGLERRA